MASEMGTLCFCGMLRPDRPFSRPAGSNPLSWISRGDDLTHFLKVTLCFGGVVAEGFVANHLSVANLCREMAAQACYKPYVFDSLPYVYDCICINVYMYKDKQVHVDRLYSLIPTYMYHRGLGHQEATSCECQSSGVPEN